MIGCPKTIDREIKHVAAMKTLLVYDFSLPATFYSIDW